MNPRQPHCFERSGLRKALCSHAVLETPGGSEAEPGEEVIRDFFVLDTASFT